MKEEIMNVFKINHIKQISTVLDYQELATEQNRTKLIRKILNQN